MRQKSASCCNSGTGIPFTKYEDIHFKHILLPKKYDRYLASWHRYQNSPYYRRFYDLRKSQRQKFFAVKWLLLNMRLFSSVSKIWFQASCTKQPIFRALEISITYRCNYVCDQCSCRLTYNPERTEMIENEYIDVIDQALELGALQFNLTGGEPLLRTDLVLHLLRYIRSKNRMSHLCTNASLLPGNFEKLLDAGLCSLEMGLDSADRFEHDENRRKDSFDLVHKFTTKARQKGIPVILNTIATKSKIRNHDLLALIELAGQWGATVQLTPPCLTGAWRGKTAIVLDDNERLFYHWLLGLPNVRSDIFSGVRITACSAGREKLALTPYGDILPCSLIQISYGNIREEHLSDIWERIRKDSWFTQEKACRLGCPTSFDWEFIRAMHLDQLEPRHYIRSNEKESNPLVSTMK